MRTEVPLPPEGPKLPASCIDLRGLVKKYPGFQLGPADWRLAPGEVAGLVGPNGAGKTTTINILAGLIRPDAGYATVFGEDVTRIDRSRRARIGLVRDEPALPEHSVVGRLLRATARFYPEWDDRLVGTLLLKFRIDTTRQVKMLSKGTKLKLHIIMALAHHPQVLLLDEPFSGLDLIAKQDLRDVLFDIREARESSVLLSSHNVAEIERLCDTVTLLSRGQLLWTGVVGELPAHWRRWEFRAGVPIQPPAGVHQQAQKHGVFVWLTENSNVDVRRYLSDQHATDLLETVPSLEDIVTILLTESEARS